MDPTLIMSKMRGVSSPARPQESYSVKFGCYRIELHRTDGVYAKQQQDVALFVYAVGPLIPSEK